MTRKEAASCINTIVILKNLCYRVRGLMDVIDAQNCDKIIEMLNTVGETHKKHTETHACDTISRQDTITEIKNYERDSTAPIDYVKIVEQMPPAQPEQHWIPCSERLPECEQEVLICTKKKVVGKNAYIDSIITPALYEDGTMLEIDSKWRWEDIDYDKWDEENDCGIIPEGWWENRHFNPDDVYNNVVDREVVAWMPLPEPYREDEDV